MNNLVQQFAKHHLQYLSRKCSPKSIHQFGRDSSTQTNKNALRHFGSAVALPLSNHQATNHSLSNLHGSVRNQSTNGSGPSIDGPESENRHEDEKQRSDSKFRVRSMLTGAGGLILGASLFSWKSKQDETSDIGSISVKGRVPGQFSKSEQVNPSLPVYSMAEISKHYNASTGIWVSFNRGVYDMTEFVPKHPGGNRILLGAGGSLEPFWELYPIHQRPDILEILEKYRIGNLAEEDVISEGKDSIDHFKGEPRRHPALIARSLKPFNGETPPHFLVEQLYTPNDLFYVRNHLPVPDINAKSYELEIEGINIPKSKTLKLSDLKKLPKVEISATIQCGGNRRSEMGKTKPVAGLDWSGGAIGNAKWAGARLKDVLALAGFKPESYKNPEKIHVQFEGMDSDPSGECYGASVPLSYILDGNFEPVLAYEMNSKTLPVDHGFPIRIVLPGIVGARSVKWLNRIVISDQENQSPWQQRDYKIFSPSVTMETVNFADAPAIMDTPVTSYICSHENGQVVSKGMEVLKGYAFSGGGRSIVRVEVSADQGKTWAIAKHVGADKTGTRNWSWVLWELPFDFTNLKGNQEIWVKAVDSGYNQQAENIQNIWNYRGLLSTAYHKINVTVK